MNKSIDLWLLTLILVAGLVLRLWNFDQIAPMTSDEAMHMRQARLMKNLGLIMTSRDVPVIDESKTGIWKHVRKSDWFDKPSWLHSAFIALWMLPLGESDAAGAATSVAFSMLAIVLVYLLGKRIANSQAGLTAALFLSVSGYWLINSRSLQAEVDSACFVLLAFYLLIRGAGHCRLALPPGVPAGASEARRWGICQIYACLAGIAAAVAVLCHYRLLYIVAPLLLVMVLLVESQPRERSVSRWLAVTPCLILVLSFGLTFGAVELVLHMAMWVFDPGFPFSGLFGALSERYLATGHYPHQTGVQPGNLVAFSYYLLRNNGVAMMLLVVMSPILALAKISPRHGSSAKASNCDPEARSRLARVVVLSLIIMVIVPLVILVFQIWVVARAISVVLPFTALLAGIAFAGLSDWLGGGAESTSSKRSRIMRGAFQVLFLLAVLMENLWFDARLIGNQMGHVAVCRILKQEMPERVYADRESASIYAWYAPELHYYSLDTLGADLREQPSMDAVAIFDAQAFHMYPESVQQRVFLEQAVARNYNVRTFESLTTMMQEFLFEGTQAHTLQGMLESVRSHEAETTIRCYDLAGFGKMPE